MRRSNVALRLQPSLFQEAKRISKMEGVALNQFINVAVAEKVSALRTRDYFRERQRRPTWARRNASCAAQAAGILRHPAMNCFRRQDDLLRDKYS
jgi:hypothetical protein